ncbi:MAG: hypothetical protein N3A69_05720, partial [Leptospiraceae bacterium]|nr:hypothetical protein [Leptospiraceae bacterium]
MIAKQKFKTNEYGTFHGNFILPTLGLNGIFTLRTTNHSYEIHVEEYKRPKFEVTIENPKGSYRLKEKVQIKGNAKTYSGAPVDSALVQFRVLRKAIIPPWWYWWRSYSTSSEQEISSGKAKTNEKGEFNFEFEAIPDETISPESKPYFEYQVTVDVTDSNGETQTGTTVVSVGYTALNLSLNVSSFIEKTSNQKWNLYVTNLSGEKEPALVSIKIFKLKSPSQTYRARKWEAPYKQILNKAEWQKLFPNFAYLEEDKIQNWEKEKQVFTTQVDSSQTLAVLPENLGQWENGAYYLEASTKDKFGEEVNAKYFFTLYGVNDKTLPYKSYDLWIGVKTKGEPEEEFHYLTSQAPKTKALYELEHQGKVIYSEWLEFANEESFYSIKGKLKEEYRGNLGLHFTFVKENQIFSHTETITVPYSNKELKISYETFRNKLYPSSKEEWKLKITGPKGEKVAAEMLASLYDASLDAFVLHSYSLPIYHSYYPQRIWNRERSFLFQIAIRYAQNWNPYNYYEQLSYDSLNWFGFEYYSYTRHPRMLKKSGAARRDGFAEMEDMKVSESPPTPAPAMERESSKEEKPKVQTETPSITKKDAADVPIRSNFQETAFFYPQLETDSEGNIIIKFQMPDTLTKWKFLSFAHTKDLMLGFSQNEVVTQKDLMVTPNPPRFFREGDTIYFGAKIINLTSEVIKGKVNLTLSDALNGNDISEMFGNFKELEFSAKVNQSTYVEWKLQIPKDISAVNYRIVARSENFSDGEEMTIPILTNRQLVTESLPLSIKGGETKTFELKKLTSLKESPSSTLTHHRLTFEFTPNPAWYAVQALPYLMEYPYECVEQTFSRFYANSLSHHIVNSNPKIKKVFESWKKIPSSEKGALASNLEKNQELKNILLEQTPWVREAIDEGERKKRIAFLFDINRMTSELEKALRKVLEQQLSEGGWGWFIGFPPDRYITSHIISGLGQLSKLGVNEILKRDDVQAMLKKALVYLDRKILEDYNELKRLASKKILKLEDDNLTYIQIHYLYTRSFFLEIPIHKESQEAVEYFQRQAKKYWFNKNIYAQGMLAIALYRWEEKETPKKIVESLQDRALHSQELGMYWKFNYGFYWYELPIETHSLMIELFEEVANDKKAVDSLKTWLLKQKQTTDWKTTKATANAIYALLLRGEDWLNTENDVTIQLGKQVLDPKKDKSIQVEEGTGYFKKYFSSKEILPEMGKVTLQKRKAGVSWGSLYWQYFENLDRITTHETPLKLKKELYILENT